MKAIRYKVHFPILALAAIIYWLLQNVDFAVRALGLNVFDYILMGVLHSASIVISLRVRKATFPVTAPSFIVLAAVWSAATPILALSSIVASGSLLDKAFHIEGLSYTFAFLVGSAIGSAGYWLLVRLFWVKALRPADCFKTVALCVAATLVSYGVGMLDQRGDTGFTSTLFTVAWWLAFSGSLYWAEIRGCATKTAVVPNIS